MVPELDPFLQNLQTGALGGGERRAVRVPVVGDIVHLFPQQFGGSPPEHRLRRGIDVGDLPLGIEWVEALGRTIHGTAEPLFTLVKSLLIRRASLKDFLRIKFLASISQARDLKETLAAGEPRDGWEQVGGDA